MSRVISLVWSIVALLTASGAWAQSVPPDVQQVHPGYYIGPNGPFLQHITNSSTLPVWLGVLAAMLIVGFMLCIIVYGAIGGPKPSQQKS